MSVSYFTEMGTCVLSNRSLCSGVCVVFDHVEIVLCSAYCDGRCADVSLSIHSFIHCGYGNPTLKCQIHPRHSIYPLAIWKPASSPSPI